MRCTTSTRWRRNEDALPQPAGIFTNKEGKTLFVGDIEDICNVERLQKLRIGFVLNLCPDHSYSDNRTFYTRLSSRKIKVLNWQVKDNEDVDIIAEVVDLGACDYIDMGLRTAGVLVNCYGGVNCSATVAIAYLVLKCKVGLVAAVRKTMEARGTVLTYANSVTSWSTLQSRMGARSQMRTTGRKYWSQIRMDLDIARKWEMGARSVIHVLSAVSLGFFRP